MTGLRPSIDAYFIDMAKLVATRTTCLRRAVGCVITDKYNHVLSTGYNGVYSGSKHCIDDPCEGVNEPSGTSLHLCKAIHAEVNALIQCKNINEIYSVYTSTSPCINCMRLLANTSVKRIVFNLEYPHYESKEIAISKGISWICFCGTN